MRPQKRRRPSLLCPMCARNRPMPSETADDNAEFRANDGIVWHSLWRSIWADYSLPMVFCNPLSNRIPKPKKKVNLFAFVSVFVFMACGVVLTLTRR